MGPGGSQDLRSPAPGRKTLLKGLGDILESTLRVEGLQSNLLHRFCVLELVRPQNRILVPFRISFQNFDKHPVLFILESPQAIYSTTSTTAGAEEF